MSKQQNSSPGCPDDRPEPNDVLFGVYKSRAPVCSPRISIPYMISRLHLFVALARGLVFPYALKSGPAQQAPLDPHLISSDHPGMPIIKHQPIITRSGCMNHGGNRWWVMPRTGAQRGISWTLGLNQMLDRDGPRPMRWGYQ